MTQDAKWREKIQNQDWSKTGLKDYLLYDKWDQNSACCVLAGLDFHQNRESKGDMLLDTENYFDFLADGYEKILDQISIDYSRLKAFSATSDQEREYDTPRAYIDWALSKQFKPLWLDWAIGKNLYIPKQEAIQEKIETANADTIYSTKWLEVQQAAIEEFFSPRHEVDAKKEEVIQWIEMKAKELKIRDPNRIATSIFTIIKPEDHSPRKRRVAPQ